MSQRLIPPGERSGLQKPTATTGDVSLCVRARDQYLTRTGAGDSGYRADGLTQTNALRCASCSPGKLCLAGFNRTSGPPLVAFDPNNRGIEQGSGHKDDRIVVGTAPANQQLALIFREGMVWQRR